MRAITIWAHRSRILPTRSVGTHCTRILARLRVAPAYHDFWNFQYPLIVNALLLIPAIVESFVTYSFFENLMFGHFNW